MNKIKLIILYFLFSCQVIPQSVIINELYNSFAEDEWVELLIIQDGLDMRGYELRDFSAQGNPQQPLVFSNSNLWNNLKAGTIIIVARPENNLPEDLDPSDCLLSVNTNNITYFNGNPFYLATSSDAIQILNSSQIHIFGISWGSINQESIPQPKIHFANSWTPNNTSTIFNGNSLSQLMNITNWTFKTTSVTRGEGNTIENKIWINTLRVSSLDHYKIILMESDFWGTKNQNIIIQGSLKDWGNNGIPNKQIRVYDACKKLCTYLTTTSNGTFQYQTKADRAGIYQLEFEYLENNIIQAGNNALVSIDNNEVIALFKSVKLKNVSNANLIAKVTYKGTSLDNSYTEQKIEKYYTISPLTSMTVIDGTNLNYTPRLIDNTPGTGIIDPPISVAHETCPIQFGIIQICGPHPDDPNAQEFYVGTDEHAIIQIGASFKKGLKDFKVVLGIGYGVPYVLGGSATLSFGSSGMGMQVSGGIGMDQWTVEVWNSETSAGMSAITMHINSPIDPFITTSNNKTIGIDPITGKFKNNIPFSSYNGPANEPQEIIIPGIYIGNFNLNSTGTGNGRYIINKDIRYNGNSVEQQIINGIAKEDSIFSLNVFVDTIRTNLPSPDSFRVNNINRGVYLQWKKVNSALGYKIYYRQASMDSGYKGTGAFEGNSPVEIGDTNNLCLNNLTLDSTYYFTITAYDSNNTQSGFSNEVYTKILGTIDYNIARGWNIISLPCISPNNAIHSIFPSVVSYAFAYNPLTGYTIFDTLVTQKGYWIKSSINDNGKYIGTYLLSDSLLLLTGWNLFGSISNPVAVSSIQSDPPGMITSSIYGYKGTYFITDTIQPGKGYWVKVNQPGKLILSSDPITNPEGRIRIVHTNELPPPPPTETSVKEEIPLEYAMEQCYPNPFNPLTTIKYQVPANSRVTLKIYNTLGQGIKTLVDEIQETGYKKIEWNSTNNNGLTVASGIYFYRIEATSVSDPSKSFTQVRKMILMR